MRNTTCEPPMDSVDDKPKNEESCRSLSIVTNSGRNLFAISEHDRGYKTNPSPNEFTLLVTYPGEKGLEVSGMVLNRGEVHALITMLQDIVEVHDGQE